MVVKWVEPLRIQINGTPTARDWDVLRDIANELKELTGLDILFVTEADGTHNIDMYFVTVSQFGNYERHYVPGNNGFFWLYWDYAYRLKYATILIDTGINDYERPRFIREELTQAMGLARDSYAYQDSIFYQDKFKLKDQSVFTQYSPLDRDIIRLLYSSDIKPGMSSGEILRLSEP